MIVPKTINSKSKAFQKNLNFNLQTKVFNLHSDSNEYKCKYRIII